MRFLVDTNVLLAATIEELPDHAEACVFMKHLINADSQWCLSWVNVYEFLRVATHPRVFARPLKWKEARSQMDVVLSNPYLDILTETDRHLTVLDETAAEAGSVSGNFVHDCHIATLMQEYDVRRIVTFDMHFRRFSHLDVLRPSDVWR